MQRKRRKSASPQKLDISEASDSEYYTCISHADGRSASRGSSRAADRPGTASPLEELPLDEESEGGRNSHMDWRMGISPDFKECEHCANHEFSIWWKRMRSKHIKINLRPERYEKIRFEDFGSYEDVGSKLLAKLGHPKCRCHLASIEGDLDSEGDDFKELLDRYFGPSTTPRFVLPFPKAPSPFRKTEASTSAGYSAPSIVVGINEPSTSRGPVQPSKPSKTVSFDSISSVSTVDLPIKDTGLQTPSPLPTSASQLGFAMPAHVSQASESTGSVVSSSKPALQGSPKDAFASQLGSTSSHVSQASEPTRKNVAGSTKLAFAKPVLQPGQTPKDAFFSQLGSASRHVSKVIKSLTKSESKDKPSTSESVDIEKGEREKEIKKY